MTQYPAAKLLGVLPLQLRHIMDLWICFVPTLCSWSYTLCSLSLKSEVFYVILSVGKPRVQMTNATPSLPPAVNSLRLDPGNHLPSVAQHSNALPHGLITTTLFQLQKE